MVRGNKYNSGVIATAAENQKDVISRKYEDRYCIISLFGRGHELIRRSVFYIITPFI